MSHWSVLLVVFGLSSGCHAGVFNVMDYGAVGDNTTDNTAAFSACLDAILTAGGGQMFLPAGVYRGRITIPAVAFTGSWVTLEIVGDGQPTPIFGTVGTADPTRGNFSVVTSLNTSGSAVISATPTGPSPDFSAVYVVLKNLEVRTYDDPRIGGIDLQWAQQCNIENVVVGTGVYNVQASQPTHGATGLWTPGINNAALTILRNVVVTGYQTGINCNEHTDADSIVVAGNSNGLSFSGANHASRFGRVGAYRNTVHVAVTGVHGFSITQLAIENAGPGQTTPQNAWQKTVYDIDDPGNNGFADVNYWVVTGNVGPTVNFTKHGGASIQARRIGSSRLCPSRENSTT